MTTPTSNIEKALMLAWADFPTIKKDKANDFAKFNYASLTQITEEIKPAMVKHGLRLSYDQKTTESMDMVMVKAVVTHAESGESKESDYLGLRIRGKKSGTEATPQDLMAMITYLKRYVVTGLLGLTTDDPDVDDMDPAQFQQTAQPATKKQQQPAPQPAPTYDPQEKARQECLKILRGYFVSHGEPRIREILNLTDLGKLKKLDLRSLNSAKEIIEKALANSTAPDFANEEETLHA